MSFMGGFTSFSHAAFPFLLWLRFGQLFAGLADQMGEELVVVDVGNVKVVFRSLVGWAEVDGGKEAATNLGGFDVEMVVADETENLSTAVDGVVSKHLSGSDFTCATALVGDVLDEVGIACHCLFVIQIDYPLIDDLCSLSFSSQYNSISSGLPFMSMVENE